ncbi:MAG: sugar ABC transporter permease, partial [Acetobacteraceae bacterium]
MATQSSRLAARLMVAPSVIVLFIWMIIPLAMTLYYSFRLYRLISPDRTGWTGFR